MSSQSSSRRPLLRSQWTELVALNFEIDPKILQPRVPPGTELAFHNDATYVSLVAMVLRNGYAAGWPFRLFRQVQEVNLRFYVHRQDGPRLRRGACFIRDYVPSRRAAWLLGWIFNATFDYLPMQNSNTGFNGAAGDTLPHVNYQFKVGTSWNRIRVQGHNLLNRIHPESKVQFILNHDHEYSRRGNRTLEYEIERSTWRIWSAGSATFDCDAERLFGAEFAKPLNRRPASVFLTRGGEVTVYRPHVIRG